MNFNQGDVVARGVIDRVRRPEGRGLLETSWDSWWILPGLERESDPRRSC